MDGDNTAKTFEQGANSAMKGGQDMVDGIHEGVKQTVSIALTLIHSLPLLLSACLAPIPSVLVTPHILFLFQFYDDAHLY